MVEEGQTKDTLREEVFRKIREIVETAGPEGISREDLFRALIQGRTRPEINRIRPLMASAQRSAGVKRRGDRWYLSEYVEAEEAVPALAGKSDTFEAVTFIQMRTTYRTITLEDISAKVIVIYQEKG